MLATTVAFCADCRPATWCAPALRTANHTTATTATTVSRSGAVETRLGLPRCRLLAVATNVLSRPAPAPIAPGEVIRRSLRCRSNWYSTANNTRKTLRDSQSTNDYRCVTLRGNSLIGRMLPRTLLPGAPQLHSMFGSVSKMRRVALSGARQGPQSTRPVPSKDDGAKPQRANALSTTLGNEASVVGLPALQREQPAASLQTVGRALHSRCSEIGDVGVDHGHRHAGVAQQFQMPAATRARLATRAGGPVRATALSACAGPPCRRRALRSAAAVASGATVTASSKCRTWRLAAS